ncbi:glucokinase [Piscinibacter sakaiensis]|uniref:glucokinase n=1 Tax=Piscinibacter sakaiensis TaxID=1547922 RepID=UPI0037269199
MLRCADFDGVGPLLAHYLHERGAGRPVACAIGIASPVSGDRVAMTNLPWRFSIAGLQAELGLQRLRVVNDFTALALALPVLAADELEAVGGGAPRSVDLFLALLGSVAGNLALTLGAQRGVFIGGGIVPRLGDRIHRSAFRERFEAKGRYRGYLAAIPTWVIRSASPPALRGAAQALELPG